MFCVTLLCETPVLCERSSLVGLKVSACTLKSGGCYLNQNLAVAQIRI